FDLAPEAEIIAGPWWDAASRSPDRSLDDECEDATGKERPGLAAARAPSTARTGMNASGVRPGGVRGTRRTDMAPSPAAKARRLTEPLRTSPAVPGRPLRRRSARPLP